MVLTNGIRMLVGIVIVKFHLNKFGFTGNTILWGCHPIVIQTKHSFYHDQYSMDWFLPLVLKVFGCLHQQFSSLMCERIWKPSSFDFTFILHAKSVNDVITNVSGFYFEV